ncbi:uncharacterized protein LOC142321885 [Lycorma delicatula]|uniref:uncharacterized protein LOC142321885 n=1 Tax=Lycorma delicatula TaxID=130591 RepID=UPI003F510BCD
MANLSILIPFLLLVCVYGDHGKLSEEIRAVLEHYKSADPVGIPGAHIPDPMPIPPIKQSFSLATLKMFNSTVHGLSQFRIETIFSNFADMQLVAALRIEELQVKGNYTLRSWLSRSAGECTVTLSDVFVEGLAMMEVARYGNLEAADIQMDITVNKITLDFTNLGFLAKIFQGMMNSIGSFVFDSIKPFILEEVNAKIRGRVNNNMRQMKQTFPNSIPPLDLAIAEGRKYVRKMGYDPYKISDYTQSLGFIGFYVTNTWLTGLSSFYRVGNVTASVENNILQFGFHVGSQELQGKCNWEISAAGIASHLGSTCFTVDYFQVEAKINQALDTRKHPELEDLQLKLGNIQLRIDGTGTLDYVLEFLINFLPNLLRYQIMDALEEPLKRRAQDILKTVNVEKFIEEKLPELERMSTETESDNITSEETALPAPNVEDAIPTTMEGLVVDESQLDQNIF